MTTYFIAHRRIAPAGGSTLAVIDPSDGQPYAQIARGDARDIHTAVLAEQARNDATALARYFEFYAGGGIELPFGGVKRSGYGREKGFEALYGFTVLKTGVAPRLILCSRRRHPCA